MQFPTLQILHILHVQVPSYDGSASPSSQQSQLHGGWYNETSFAARSALDPGVCVSCVRVCVCEYDAECVYVFVCVCACACACVRAIACVPAFVYMQFMLENRGVDYRRATVGVCNLCVRFVTGWVLIRV
jgi:hypothetical protein